MRRRVDGVSGRWCGGELTALVEGGEEVKCYCLEGDSCLFFFLLPTLILPAYRSTMLTACVFVTRDTVRHQRRSVFGKFVRKPNCS